MNLENIVSVSGLPGLYKMVGSRNNGLIIEDYDEGKKRFASIRKHQFTPLESVSIYTITDTAPLTDIFKKMQESSGIPDPKADALQLQEFFEGILPDYDEDKVLTSDIRKIIKWFNFLQDRKLLTAQDEEE